MPKPPISTLSTTEKELSSCEMKESQNSRRLAAIGNLFSAPPAPSSRLEDDDTVCNDSPNSLMTQQDETDEDFFFGSRKTLDFGSNLDASSDDDDGSSLDDDDESSIEEELTLAEKRKQNEERNAQRHRDLFGEHFLQDLKQTKRKRQKDHDDEEEEEISFTKPRGMLLKSHASRFNALSSLDIQNKDSQPDGNDRAARKAKMTQLLQRYPNREAQIRQLGSLFCATIGQATRKQSNGNSQYVPAPIFVTGPDGSGKTSVVRDTLYACCQKNASVESAYINCNTLEPATIGRLVTSIYNQLQPEEYRNLKTKRRKKRRRKQQANDEGSQPLSTERTSTENDDPNTTNKEQGTALNNDARDLIKTDSDEELEASRRRVQPTRAAKKDLPLHSQVETKSSQHEAAALGDSVETKNSVEIFYSVVVALGRSLQSFFGVNAEAGKCAFVILDHCPESLMSLSGKKTNFLAELLLLPKVMGLNLTFVVVTRNCTLHVSRLNNLVNTKKCLATIASGLHPTIIQFPAYIGKGCFLKVLKTEHVVDSIVGRYPTNSHTPSKMAFMKKAIDAFLISLVQFVSDSTRDIKCFMRLGRALWPVFIAPLHPQQIDATLKSIAGGTTSHNDAAVETKLLTYLGQKFFQYTGTISGEDITSLLLDPSSIGQPPRTSLAQCHVNLPYYQSCLLLAAFICQHNRSDQDKKVFAAEGNGKRRKKQSQDRGDDEHLAFSASTSELKQLQSLRPRPFQVERVLSIFVTLIRLNPIKLGHFPEMDDVERTKRLGSSFLYKDLAQLIDLGYLHPTNFVGTIKNEQINFNGAKFWCSMTREEASTIAKRVNIPLDNYIV